MSETTEWTSRVSGTSDIELRLKCAAQAKEIVSLKEELALWKPMTPEEAEAAYDAAEAIPMEPGEIEAMVDEIIAQCEDPAYRPSEPEHIRMLQRVRFLERVNTELERKAAHFKRCWFLAMGYDDIPDESPEQVLTRKVAEQRTAMDALERKAARWDECERLAKGCTVGVPDAPIWWTFPEMPEGPTFAAAIDAAIEAREKETTNQ